ncbi:hypothetical protein P153DRAFT_313892 [Dothidotthia symphoricarpi CBS 119687]|uniref:C2H2-type domain-containing protein n=1 Tax=Dothidotthia symphoricarpi CBS 119687 TaxID=1392245 RepID=A0A6A6AEJ9_9PLEO|nr:uncharacterized protein P153DRAFT_313892 [Dothidotthia symphoricarpi CBS 119687]KAF2130240.1 hypothetical protein P153DRAFT_313892 [Dothidotthia symphoricarpi CBS 119687]
MLSTMSVSILSPGAETESSFQPFQCSICHARFTRHENLKRHTALHSRSHKDTSLFCDICHATFSRPDLRLRHLKRKHPEIEDLRPKKRRATRDVNSKRSQEAISSLNSPGRSRHGSYTQYSGDEDKRDKTRPLPPTTQQHNRHSICGTQHLPHRNIESTRFAERASLRDEQDSIPALLDPITQHALSSGSTSTKQNSQPSTHLDLSSMLLQSLFDSNNGFNNHSSLTTTPPASFNAALTGFDFDQWSPDRLLSIDLPQARDNWLPSTAQVTQGCGLFFAHCSSFLPFLHRATFSVEQVPKHLLLSLLCLGYQHGANPGDDLEKGSGESLSIHCFHRARALIAAEEENLDSETDGLCMVQTYLFLQVFAMMYSCDNDSAYGLKTHSKMISLARGIGLMQDKLAEAPETKHLDSLWQQFIQAETRKRTAFAIHQIDTLWYQIMSTPRLISHLEVKHELPCPENFWAASSSSEWAYGQLIARNSGSTMQYSDVVRRMLSSHGDLKSIPAFDPYGSINITQFLTSSAREISGWSTMTGMLSMERLEPIRASLLALGVFIRPELHVATMNNMALCEATWEAAMIEMQMWSPSHTGGIVASSVDAALDQLTHFSPSCEFLCESNIANSVQPHVDWFLRYLDTTTRPDFEAPWITIYAWRAVMIAWQLFCSGIAGALQVVGVEDGDKEEALRWARKVFQRRERWKLGKTVLSCLDTLDR